MADHPTSLVLLFNAMQYLVTALWVSNLVVGIFNMLPGLPLDGGRVLRSAVWLAISRNPLTGTVAAAWTGRVLAVGVLIYAMVEVQDATSSDGLYTLGLGPPLHRLVHLHRRLPVAHRGPAARAHPHPPRPLAHPPGHPGPPPPTCRCPRRCAGPPRSAPAA